MPGKANVNGKKLAVMRINVPFCESACEFCGRQVIASRNSAALHGYALALLRELEANAGEFTDCQVEAVRFGGGAASALDGRDFWLIYSCVRGNYRLAPNAPVTMLANPLDINGGNLPFFNRANVFRYDLEVMSMEPRDFLWLDWPDTTGWMPVVREMIRADRRNNLGIVLLFGHEKLGEIQLIKSLSRFVTSGARHLTLRRWAGEGMSGDDQAAAQRRSAAQWLSAHGFMEYAPLKFAQPGFEDTYTRLKLTGSAELAFGLGARTRIDGAVSVNTMNPDTYLRFSHDFSRITERAYPDAGR